MSGTQTGNWRAMLQRIDEYRWEIPADYKPGMRVPARIYADEALLDIAGEEQALEQAANVATLPGIVWRSLAMPDIHWGYGFPIGGVAAMRLDDGVVSPGGVGFDINCGTRADHDEPDGGRRAPAAEAARRTSSSATCRQGSAGAASWSCRTPSWTT